MAGSTAWGKEQALFHTESWVYRLESEEQSIVADIGFEVVVATGTILEVVGIVFK